MKIVTFRLHMTSFRKCAASCGTIRHYVGTYDRDGQMYVSYACVRCHTTVLTDNPIGKEEPNVVASRRVG